MVILGRLITFGSEGTPESPAAAGGVYWGHEALRRIVFVRPFRSPPTAIVEAGQTEDPT